MLRFLPGSLRLHAVTIESSWFEMKDRAVGHQHSNGMEKLHYIAKSIGTPPFLMKGLTTLVISIKVQIVMFKHIMIF